MKPMDASRFSKGNKQTSSYADMQIHKIRPAVSLTGAPISNKIPQKARYHIQKSTKQEKFKEEEEQFIPFLIQQSKLETKKRPEKGGYINSFYKTEISDRTDKHFSGGDNSTAKLPMSKQRVQETN
jgi:hypothetical protein